MPATNDTGPAIGIKTDIVVQGNVNIAKDSGNQYQGQFVGPLAGNADSATILQTARSLNVQDGQGHTGTQASFNGSANAVITLPSAIQADITGSVSGNAGSATILQTARNINIQDSTQAHTGTQASFNGSSDVIIKLPATISAAIAGNQSSATKLKTARNINIQDADGTNVGTQASFNGTQNVVISLPSTIKADLTGNADTATSATTASKIGSSTIGGTSKPVYINQGVPQQISGPIGAQATPVYIAADGTITQGTQLKSQAYKDVLNSLQQDSSDLPTGTQVRSFVNSSVSTNTANYISNNGEPFTSVQQLEAYTGTVTNNDYQFVTGTDSAGNTYYDRYKATVSGSTVSWAKEYRLNNSSFTSTQWDQISSGVVQQDVTNIRGIIAGTTSVPNATYATSAGSATSATTAGTCTGNQGSATMLATARDINVQDADGSHTGTQASFNGTAAATIKLPQTIKATLIGNADTATSATTATTATKLGSNNVGDSSHPIYLSQGQPVQCSSISATDADHVPYTGITSNPWHVTDYTPVPPGIPPTQWSMTTLIVNNQAHDSG